MTLGKTLKSLLAMICVAMAASCGGGGGNGPPPPPSDPTTPPPARAFETPPIVSLTTAEVGQVIAQAVAEAEARGRPSTIAVVDRPGNVLAVFRMSGVPDDDTEQIRPGPAAPANVGVQGLNIPRDLTAIAKAVTGAYLSSSGNAFSTRTASAIVQERFTPAPTTVGFESGPLFGVQISQLPCSDLSTRFGVDPRFGAGSARIGPNRSPLGFSADPGGIPLYKDGFVVGGIGVSTDNDYGFDPNINDFDTDIEEIIAVAGTIGFESPVEIRGDRIPVDGDFLRFTDVDTDDTTIFGNAGSVPSFNTINGTSGQLVHVLAYTTDIVDPASRPAPVIQAGTAYGTNASGFTAATPAQFSNPDAFLLTDGTGANRYPPRAGTDGANVADPLTTAEVTAILEEAFAILSISRAQIRRPLDSIAQVSITVVDTNGEILGFVRSPDAPIFGIDVALQKARTAAFFSGPDAADDLNAKGTSPLLDAVRADNSILDGTILEGLIAPDPNARDYVQLVRDFIVDPNALTGGVAFADRSGGNLARPFFPDGEVGTPNGPISLPINTWSIFATGLQVDLVLDNILEHVAHTQLGTGDTAIGCTFLPNTAPSDTRAGERNSRLKNGIQIFPGSVPIYKGDTLVGGIGVSGDGIDQDDMVSFLGLHNAGLRIGTVNNADPAIRADRITIDVNGEEVRLRYINCPFNPFVNNTDQNVCQGL